MSRLRVPPGRSGRLRLRRRLATAHRAADLLDRKLRILRREQERLDLLVERTGRSWEAASRIAETWMLRAALLANQRGIRLATTDDPIRVRIEWTATMGTRFPASAACDPPQNAARQAGPFGSAALYQARDAYRRAIEAAVQHAAASAAVRTVTEEVTATRMRLRAIEDRSIPRLLDALAQLELAVDEQEHADTARLRRAAMAADSPVAAGRASDTASLRRSP